MNAEEAYKDFLARLDAAQHEGDPDIPEEWADWLGATPEQRREGWRGTPLGDLVWRALFEGGKPPTEAEGWAVWQALDYMQEDEALSPRRGYKKPEKSAQVDGHLIQAANLLRGMAGDRSVSEAQKEDIAAALAKLEDATSAWIASSGRRQTRDYGRGRVEPMIGVPKPRAKGGRPRNISAERVEAECAALFRLLGRNVGTASDGSTTYIKFLRDVLADLGIGADATGLASRSERARRQGDKTP